MNLRLQYTEARSDGIFGWALDAGVPPEDEARPQFVFVTRAVKQLDGTYRPIVRAGTYDCERGIHHLQKAPGAPLIELETFEVMGVKGHSGIVFHWGNFGSDSKACFCTGRKIVRIAEDRDGVDGPDEMVTESRRTFAEFMTSQVGIDHFQLVVEELWQTSGG
jgi:hypothetical protein